MNFQNRYLSLVEFLSSYSAFWQREVLNDYPETIEAYPVHWLELLDSKSDEELHEIDGKNNPKSIEGTPLSEFINKIQELIKLPRETYNPGPLPSWAYMRVKEKKKHEIDCLREVIIPLKEKTGFTKIADIGGGVGNFSRIMAHYHGIPTTCLDMNEDFIEKGKKRRTKYPLPENAAKLSFEKFMFGVDKGEVLKKHFGGDGLSLGLHTCGPLALEHLKAFHENGGRAMLNFGCCYSKMDPLSNTNLSSFAKEHPLDYTLHGLTLATRSHSTMSFEDFKLKERVKSYRYTLHLYMQEILKVTEFQTLGEAPARVYWGNFSDYALLKLKGQNIDQLPTSKELEDFYQNNEVKKKVRHMFLANIIRWQLGRAVELTILLDRCLYLEELGHRTELLQVFNEELSPRNLGILSY
ncbi:MAG: hypothetical protein CME70_23165 [Halobacteriovorax sp.]|nr:hypothetical protein [Halobacteriovorax sp.]